MRATKVTYERVHNLGNFENERVGIEIELEGDDKAEEALRLARIFVNRGLRGSDGETTHNHSIVADETDKTEPEIIAGELERV